MEDFNFLDRIKEGDQINLPPGFRFHPTDEELITYYLWNKVADNSFSCRAIGEVDMNRTEPWNLPRFAKLEGKEWYFYCMRDKKYPTGMRTNRATSGGYWKATGKDWEIFRRELLVGMKKTLVFYKGKAPKGEKMNWVAHEFRLEGNSGKKKLNNSDKNDWVIIRVFLKKSGGNKVISWLTGMNSGDNELIPASLPPLLDFPATSACGKLLKPIESESIHAPCFSNPINTNPNFNFASNFDHPIIEELSVHEIKSNFYDG